MAHNFKTDNPQELTRALSDLLIDAIRDRPDLGDGPVADRLHKLRDAIWPEPGTAPLNRTKKELLFQEVLQDLNPRQKTQLLEGYAHMGHLYDLSALQARENYFAHEGIARGVDQFVARQPNVTTAIAKLNQPVFEVVMTMHPTNTNSLESMRTQRRLAQAIEQGDETKIRHALENFQRAPLLKREGGKDVYFSVRDETEIVLNFLHNIYDDLPRIYEQYDAALKTKAELNSPARNVDYNPLPLHLKMRFGSWGSAGDKDGNSSVTAETTLEAIAMHTDAIVSRYRTDLRKLWPDIIKQESKLGRWAQRLSEVSKTLHAPKHFEEFGARESLLMRIGQLRQDSDLTRSGHHIISGHTLEARFDDLSTELKKTRASLNAAEFLEDLTDAYNKVSNKQQRGVLLDLIRKVRTFGFNFSKIEYRETAEEYTRVVDALIPGYAAKPPQERAALLTDLLKREERLPDQFAAIKEKIIRSGMDKPYHESNPFPIAYHSLKRMELARDFPDIIQDNVLAECGKINVKKNEPEPSAADVSAQGTANMLEALFLQRVTTPDAKGHRPRLGIVPLFEEPETMSNIDHILKGVYDNAAYQAHLEKLASRHHDGKTQQVQIAHSDNARRAGLLAARAFIHEAHRKVRALNENYHIKTQFFEGGSVSDAYRNGVRAVSSSVDDFGLHDFAKFTFQGGDLLNYFNTPGSIARVFTRNIVHPADRFKQGSDGTWSVPHRDLHNELDDVVVEALKKTLKDYQTEDFTPTAMSLLLGALDYYGELKAGGRGSRAGQRGNAQPVAFGKVDSVSAAFFTGVPIDKIRTIGFSEAWQQAGIVPSWIGSKNLEGYLEEKLGKLTPARIKELYDKSSVFHDAQDRSGFALAMTDPDALARLNSKLLNGYGDTEAKQAHHYLGHVLDTYKAAGSMAYSALTGKEKLGRDKRVSRVQPLMAEALPRLAEDIARKTSYRDFLVFAKSQGELDDHQRGIIHNAGDTVIHGRYLAADDPAYGRALLEQKSRGKTATL